MLRYARPFGFAAALAVGVSGSALAQGQVRMADYETLPAGTVLKATLNQPLNSAQTRVGDRFTATLQPDEDGSGLPKGTRVEGVVREAVTASKDRPGVLDVEFTALRFPDGSVRTVSGALTSLDSKSVERNESGRLVARTSSKGNERAKFLGYGAGAGAVIGLLTGSNLLKSTLLGAVGGFAYSELKKDKDTTGRYSDVNLKEGSAFGVRLQERFGWSTVSTHGGVRYGEPVGRFDGVPGEGPDRLNSVPDVSAMPVPPTAAPKAPSPPPFRTNGIGVLVDDQEVVFGSARPTRVGQVLMLPAAPVLKAAGRRFSYNAQTRSLSIAGVKGDVRTTVGSPIAFVAGQRVRLSAPVRLTAGTLYVPVQIVELATGRRGEWDESSQTLLLTTAGASADRHQLRELRL